MRSEHLPMNYTSLLASAKIHYSAPANVQTQTTSPSTVNIYNTNNTMITVTKGAILQGWRENNIYHIPLVDMVRNNNTNTVVINRPPTKFLTKRLPPAEATFNVYKLKTQSELVRYHHAPAGFPTKPTWLAAIKNKQYASWLGLTAKGVQRHFPDSEETHKGHGRKTPSGLRSNKPKVAIAMDNDNDFNFNRQMNDKSRKRRPSSSML